MEPNSNSSSLAVPTVTLPKGGGALQGSGEKFAANPVTGAGTVSIPIALTPGRDGVGPSLTLVYDSSNGNGPFGLGWRLSSPSITRKTSRGLPRYVDDQESDIFLLSDVEDLVPLLSADGSRYEDTTHLQGYVTHRYLPRTEGSFARIERCSSLSDPEDVHWRVITPDNVLSLYGSTSESRIFDPEDRTRIFSWLLAEVRDCKGNAMLHHYMAEDGKGCDLTQAHQRNRGAANDRRRTANRYLTSIKYGNRHPLLDQNGNRPHFLSQQQLATVEWLFEAVLDYREQNTDSPPPADSDEWFYRSDCFSNYQAGFEIRTCRLCSRILMYHHFEELGENTLISSTNLYYNTSQPASTHSIYSFLTKISRSGFKIKVDDPATIIRQDIPPVEFEYSEPIIQPDVYALDNKSLQGVADRLVDPRTRWIDLYGEGIPGLLTQDASWHYNRNLSPISQVVDADTSAVKPWLSPLETVQSMPNVTPFENAYLLDLRLDGRLSNLLSAEWTFGFQTANEKESWSAFTTFSTTVNRPLKDPAVRYLDIDGDGIADIVISDDSVWYLSLGEDGFRSPGSVPGYHNEERGPQHVFSSIDESIYLADFTGDGLTDLVRLRNTEICYWPNLGYGQFGPKVSMDNCPVFDWDSHFDHKRVLLADFDGSGPTDMIYLHANSVRLYTNECGNGWSDPISLSVFSSPTNLSLFSAMDLFGNGTTVLIQATPLSGATPAVQYLDLMGQTKPHLLTKLQNNMGVSTEISYSTSTKFYLQDSFDDSPWISKLPFPIHVVDTITTYDYISRNIFSTRFAYHHGFYDIEEREFRGFGMVEQWDYDDIATVTNAGKSRRDPKNTSPAYRLPPIHTKSWYHTGIFLDGELVSGQYHHEYYQDPLNNTSAYLPDSSLPKGLRSDELLEALRCLRGRALRQEVYCDDGTTPETLARAKVPYFISESSYAVNLVQPKGNNPYAVFSSYTLEALSFASERDLTDPRMSHTMTLEVDEFGNSKRQLTIDYGRAVRDLQLPTDWDRDMQTKTILTYAVQKRTKKIDDVAAFPYGYRLPLLAEVANFELTGFDYTTNDGLASIDYWTTNNFEVLETATVIGYEEQPDLSTPQARLLGKERTIYNADDLSSHLALATTDTIGLVYERYTLALTDSMLGKYLHQNGQPLLADMMAILTSTSLDGGGFILGESLTAAGIFPDSDAPGQYWIPSGQSFFSADSTAQEPSVARSNFFIPRRYRNPFGAESIVTYDDYNLLLVEARDFIGNRVTAGERDQSGTTLPANDYRVLAPRIMTDINGNRTEIAFDALGLVICSAVEGKKGTNDGDSFQDVPFDLDESEVLAHLSDPFAKAQTYLGTATTRYFYDYSAFARSRDTDSPQPCVSYSMSRVTHVSDLVGDEKSEIIHRFSYSDGFGKSIQSKTQACPGPVPQRDTDGNILLDPDHNPVVTTRNVSPRWIVSGWVISNNKGQAVRNFEPFFSDRSGFEFDAQFGVSSVVFYDALGRPSASLMPNGIYSKVVSNPWTTETSDGNDTVMDDPRTDVDTEGLVAPFFESQPNMASFETWYQRRINGALGSEEQNAAELAATHARTPKITYLDSRGKAFLTKEIAKVRSPGHPLDGTETALYARFERDPLGRLTVSYDPLTSDSSPQGRIVMKSGFNLIGNALYKNCMEKGESWALYNIAGKPIYAWTASGIRTRFEFDVAGRPTATSLLGDPVSPTGGTTEAEVVRIVYGDNHWDADSRNLRGQIYAVLDQSGVATTERLNFEGIALEKTHRICQEYKATVDWTSVDAVIPTNPQQKIDQVTFEDALKPYLLPEVYTTSSTFDAIGRPTAITTPHSSSMQPDIIRMRYEVTSLGDLSCNLQHSQRNGYLDWTPIIKEIKEDAKGRRTGIKYGNNVVSTHVFNNVNQLTDIFSRRDQTILNADLQNLHYVYDAVGNIVRVRDDALQTNYFRGEVTTPTNDFVYDSTNRLIQAIGREHVSQGNAPTPYSDSDSTRLGPQPGQGDAMTGYTEQYSYDAASNMTSVVHTGSRGGWRRQFVYQEQSQIVGATDISNRLTQIVDGNGTPKVTRYLYDSHGNVARFPHLAGPEGYKNVTWDFQDQLRKLDLGGGGLAYYTYNMAGQRVRKVIERSPTLVEDRLYLGEIEIYRKKMSDQIVLERETLHVRDIDGRVALIETRTQGQATVNGAPAQIVRFQISNHLESSSIELDLDAQILSFEEYSPYGSTTYQATTANLETAKRYRFTGKEREEESGLAYHGARYLAPWLGRWISADPAGLTDGLNLYNYCGSNPISFKDTTGTGSEGDFSVTVHFWGPQGKDDTQRILGIDEVNPVAQQSPTGEVVGDPYARAASSAEKTFALEEFNGRKGNSEYLPIAKRQSLEPVSLEKNPELLFSRNFNELIELDLITKEAVSQVGAVREGESATAYKGRINNKIWAIIKRAGMTKAPGEMNAVERAASIVRDAFDYNMVDLGRGAPTKVPSPEETVAEGKPPPPNESGPEGSPKPTVPEGPSKGVPPEAPPGEPLVGGGGGAGKAVGVGVTVFFGAAAAGNAMQKWDQGKKQEAAQEVGSFALLTALATKIPIVGYLMIPVGAYATSQRPTTFSPEYEATWDQMKQVTHDMGQSGFVYVDESGMTPEMATQTSYLMTRMVHDAWVDIKWGAAVAKKWWNERK
jgi:RHS repeat-associated protein